MRAANASSAVTVRMGWSVWSALGKGCRLEMLFPHPDCHRGGYELDLAIALVSIMIPGGRGRLRLVPAANWGFDWSVPRGQDNDSILGLVEMGRADTNPPVMFLTQPRRERLRFTGPLYDTPFLLAYANHRSPQYRLESTRLLMEPRGFWFVMMASLLAKYAVGWTAKESRYLAVELIGRLTKRVEAQEVHWLPGKALKGSVEVWLAVGVMLSCLSNYLCLMFADASQGAQSPFIPDVKALEALLTEGSYRAVFNGAVQQKLFRDALPHVHRRVVAAQPKAFSTNVSLAKSIPRERAEDEVKHIYICNQEEYDRIIGRAGNMETVPFPPMQPFLIGLYYHLNSSYSPTPSNSTKEHAMNQRHTFAILAADSGADQRCLVGEASPEADLHSQKVLTSFWSFLTWNRKLRSNGAPSKSPEEQTRLSYSQLEGLFFSLIYFFGINICVLVAELVGKVVSSRRARKGIASQVRRASNVFASSATRRAALAAGRWKVVWSGFSLQVPSPAD